MNRYLLSLALVLVAWLGIASPARAAFGIVPGSVTSTFTNEAGEPYTQAAGRPYAETTSFRLQTKEGQNGAQIMDGNLKNLTVDLPPGFVGNPLVASYCPDAALETLNVYIQPCPVASQVGVAHIFFRGLEGSTHDAVVPVFNVKPSRNEIAAFTFSLVGQVVHVGVVLRPEDNGIEARIRGISEVFDVERTDFTLWGVPADPSHDAQRGQFCAAEGAFCFGGNQPAGVVAKPFLRMPSDCAGGLLTTRLVAESYQEPGNPSEESVTSPAPTGCEGLSFDPSLEATVGSHAAGAPTGLSVDLEMPQPENPRAPGAPDLRQAVVTLPRGMVVSTAAADGQAGCSDAQFGAGNGVEPSCPLASTIGSVTVKTPVLTEPLSGEVYLGTQTPTQLLRLFVVLHGSGGLLIKLSGRIEPDPETGQLTATFENTPQLPFESFLMRFKGGPRAPLVTPAKCGSYATKYSLTAWSGQVINGESPFTIDENCSAGDSFTPDLEAGTINPSGGTFSPFALRLTRPDGQPNIAGLEAVLPKGLLAKLGGVPLCPDPQAQTGACPAASQVGTVVVGVGAGSSPLYLPQAGKAPTAVYLAGPYKGAPYSLVAIVPAQAGPFNLGTVTVRNAIYVDPETTEVTVKSDPLPQILLGVPISYRDIRIEMNRPEFTHNPTSCEPMEIKGTIGSAEGKSANVGSRFQVGSCERLAFKPRLRISLKGSTRHAGHPALKAVLTFPKGGGSANIARAQVNLPHSEFLDPGNLNKTCTRPVMAEGKCPASTIYGKAKAWTPLLEKPLEGPVYLVGGYGYKLPALVAELNGQIRVLLVGKVDSGQNEGIRNTFEMVPDAPVERFVLEMKGGKKYGLLVNSEDLCRKAQVGLARFTGQNGKAETLRPTIANGCAKG